MALLLIPDAMFQSTHLLRGATSSHTWFSSVDPFQSTHLLRGATDCRYPIRIQFHVSIHAPLARCDRPARTGRRETAGFNPRTSCEVRPGLRLEYSKLGLVSIHAPLARCDVGYIDTWLGLHEFQSTHLLRGATHPYENSNSTRMSFNPRTSCEVRLMAVLKIKSSTGFQSTHLLRGATTSSPIFLYVPMFQSTHLLRGATKPVQEGRTFFHVSIHAPLARCDNRAKF